MPGTMMRGALVALAVASVAEGFGALPATRIGRQATKLQSSTIERPTTIPTSPSIDLYKDVELSGLQGKALEDKDFPSRSEAIAAVPEHCFKLNTWTSMKYAALSVAMTLGSGALGTLIPMKALWLPVWAAYAAATGTIATGCWVVAHECGHFAFSENKKLQTLVGFTLHSLLLVPYFSWQRSHAVHHANTNHVIDGETHVPEMMENGGREVLQRRELLEKVFGKRIGGASFGVIQAVLHLVFGWPAYLLAGVTGGVSRGITNHFVPTSDSLFPGQWKGKVLKSTLGVAAACAGLAFWASKAGVLRVAALYGAPLAVTNMWLVLYTWLQHTDVDIPHFEADEWNMMKGAFHTVDRPYGKVLDFLHHRIGSTHVAHHVESRIPHYHALEATNALKEAFPDCYLFDPTPLPQALWRVASRTAAVDKIGDKWVFVQKSTPKPAAQ